MRNRVISELGEDYLLGTPAEGGRAIHFAGSRIMENDRIELRSAYYVTPFFALSPKSGFLTGTRAVARAFTGYDNLSAVSDGDKEELLYNAGRNGISQKQKLSLSGSVYRKGFHGGYIRNPE